MQNPQTIKEAFLPLHTRLYEFESGDYLHSPGEVQDEDFEGRISHLLRTVNLFQDSEVNREAEIYELRVISIIKDLKPREKEGELDPWGNEINVKPITEVRKEYLTEEWMIELYSYLSYLRVIKKNSSYKLEGDKEIKTQIQPIILNLPENFKIPDIPKSFKPKMSTQDSALFFYYMQELELMPKYSDNAISVLSAPYFAKGSQATREGLGMIHGIKSNKEYLNSFKEQMESIIKAIDKDLLTAK